LAGAEGFEPPKAVLETAGLPLAYAPTAATFLAYQKRPEPLFSLPMRMMFTAKGTELFEFDALSGGAFIFGFAVVPIFAFAALELNNFSRHNFPFFVLSTSANTRKTGTVSSVPPKGPASFFAGWRDTSAPFALITKQSPSRYQRPRCGRLREWRSANLYPWPPG
jgi:hypothetical protein